AADLRRGAGLSADAGGVGRDGRGAGGSISGRECGGDDGTVDGGEGGVRSAARDGENVLLPRGFSVPRKWAGELAAGRKAGGRSPGIHRVCDQRAYERGAAGGDHGSAGGSLGAVWGAARGGDSGMCRGAVCTGGEVGTQTDRTFALRGDSDSQATGWFV